MIKLKSETETPSRRSRLPRLFVLLVLVVFAILLLEKCLGHWALSRWKSRMAAQGEVFEADRLWPQPTAQGRAFSNQMQQAIAQLHPGLNRYAGLVSGFLVQEPGLARRGSQEPSPVLNPSRDGTNTWEDLAQQIRQAQPVLQSLQRILTHPPADNGGEILPRLEHLSRPSFVDLRRAAQGLQAATMSDLHCGGLEGAKENLVALAAITRVYADDPTLVNYMIHIAVLGLSIEAAWDALQADGWTDAQLADLQQAFQCDQLLAQMPRAIAAQRASQLYELQWFSSHSYLAWVGRFQSLYEAIGHPIPNADAPDALVTRYFRQWVFHPVWKFAWADEEQLEYLEQVQKELDILRAAVKTGSGYELSQRLDSYLKAYRPPLACWRFYLALPWMDQSSEGFGAWRDKREYPYADFTRAWSISMKNLTLGQMVTAVIALKRYEARYGKAPVTLDTLVPEFLAQVPRDLMDGQPLRYRLNTDGSFTLYSVGEDGQDGGGDPSTADSDKDWQNKPPWAGRDWVWPRAVADAKAGAS
jgi:hypothetical protein